MGSNNLSEIIPDIKSNPEWVGQGGLKMDATGEVLYSVYLNLLNLPLSSRGNQISVFIQELSRNIDKLNKYIDRYR